MGTMTEKQNTVVELEFVCPCCGQTQTYKMPAAKLKYAANRALNPKPREESTTRTIEVPIRYLIRWNGDPVAADTAKGLERVLEFAMSDFADCLIVEPQT